MFNTEPVEFGTLHSSVSTTQSHQTQVSEQCSVLTLPHELLEYLLSFMSAQTFLEWSATCKALYAQRRWYSDCFLALLDSSQAESKALSKLMLVYAAGAGNQQLLDEIVRFWVMTGFRDEKNPCSNLAFKAAIRKGRADSIATLYHAAGMEKWLNNSNASVWVNDLLGQAVCSNHPQSAAVLHTFLQRMLQLTPGEFTGQTLRPKQLLPKLIDHSVRHVAEKISVLLGISKEVRNLDAKLRQPYFDRLMWAAGDINYALRLFAMDNSWLEANLTTIPELLQAAKEANIQLEYDRDLYACLLHLRSRHLEGLLTALIDYELRINGKSQQIEAARLFTMRLGEMVRLASLPIGSPDRIIALFAHIFQIGITLNNKQIEAIAARASEVPQSSKSAAPIQVFDAEALSEATSKLEELNLEDRNTLKRQILDAIQNGAALHGVKLEFKAA